MLMLKGTHQVLGVSGVTPGLRMLKVLAAAVN
jgi:hypothetical protein